MRISQGAAKVAAHYKADLLASQLDDHGVAAACARAARLIKDYFSRGAHHGREDADAICEEALSHLLDDVEAAVARVAAVRASTLDEIAHKRALQELLRPHRNVLSDYLAIVGKSIDCDLHRLLASETRSQAAGQGGWLGWALQSWKGPRPVEVVARERDHLNV